MMSIRRIATLVACLTVAMAMYGSVYTWSEHQLTFETPDDGWVTYNSTTRFEIRWDEMVLTIQLYAKTPGQKEKDYLPEHVRRVAAGWNMYDVEKTKYKVKGFKPYAVEGTMPDGSRAVIACLACDKRDLIVEVTVNYLLGNRDIADSIIKSFATGKNAKPNREQQRQKVQTREDAEKQRQEQQRQERQQRQEQQQPKPERDNRRVFDA